MHHTPCQAASCFFHFSCEVSVTCSATADADDSENFACLRVRSRLRRAHPSNPLLPDGIVISLLQTGHWRIGAIDPMRTLVPV